MGFREIAAIAGSAMTAQTTRLNTVASNLANANTVASSADAATSVGRHTGGVDG